MSNKPEHEMPHDMARDSSMLGRERVLIVPGNLSIDTSATVTGVASHNNLGSNVSISASSGQQENQFNQQILELRREQELQKQKLWHTFQEKNKELEMQHQLQLEQKYYFAPLSNGVFQELREQRVAVEEQQQRERREREAAARRKEKHHDGSANASTEVKQKLQSFLMKKQAAASNGMASSPYRNWGVVKSSSGESLPAGAGVASASSHPYKIPQPASVIAKYDSDYPLRKTASEPNLLKIRLKQSVIERKARAGPLAARRQERLLQAAQRRLQKHQSSMAPNCAGNTPDSGPNSPPVAGGSRGSPTNAPIQEENEDPQYTHTSRSSINDLSLFSSPSMPNISLGRPHLVHPHNSSHLALLTSLHSSAQQQQHQQQQQQHQQQQSQQQHPHHQPPPPPPYLTPTLEELAEVQAQAVAVAAANSQGITLQQHLSNLQQQQQHHHPYPGLVYGTHPITDAQVAQARLHKQGQHHRPLGRTQSAPLPLQHPMLAASASINIGQTHYENSEAERQAYEHMVLKQKIRQKYAENTALSRSSSSAMTREIVHLQEQEETGEVIDLTDKKLPPKTVITNSVITSTSQNLPTLNNSGLGSSNNINCKTDERILMMRDQDYLQQQREILIRNSMNVPSGNEDPYQRGVLRPLSRTLSSPLVQLGPQHHPGLPPGLPGASSSSSSLHQLSLSSSATSLPDTTTITLTSQPNLHANHHIQHRHHLHEQLPPHQLHHSHSLDKHPPPVNLSIASPASSTSSDNRAGLSEATGSPHKLTTGLAFDNLMLKHACHCGDNSSHPEHSGRLQSVWARLVETGLAARCDRLRSRKATLEEIQTVHTESHALIFSSSQINPKKIESSRVSFVRLACGGIGVDLDTTWNEHHTAAAARMAAGCVIDLVFKTMKGDIKNGFAVVRPPGHHAEPDLAMGFCFFNSIAIAARLLRQRISNDVKRVLIVDWDVHHGNGTQQVFYDDPNVLYLSIHRHDDGNFFPGTGGPTECGIGAGVGYNVNVAWSGGINPPLGDAEYLAAFRTVVMPIARDFAPNIVLVSSGFDAASGHPAPLGGYVVSPACFGYLTRELMQLADGKVVLALEGGYDLPAICDSAQECVRALLGDVGAPIADSELNRPPCQSAIETLQKTMAFQLPHWPCVKRFAHTVSMSAVQALSCSERDESETVTAMAGLSMHPLNRLSNLSSLDSEPMEMDQDESK